MHWKRQAGAVPAPTGPRRIALALLGSALGLLLAWGAGCGPSGERESPAGQPDELEPAAAAEAWRALERSEELIHTLEPQLRRLAFAVQNLELPDATSRGLFAREGLQIVDLREDPLGAELHELPSIGVVARPVRVGPESSARAADLALWRGLLEQVAFFEHAKFQVVRGEFAAPDEYRAEVLFQGLTRLEGGSLAAVETTQELRWQRARSTGDDAGSAASDDSDGVAADWEIVGWRTLGGRTTELATTLYREVLDEALRDPEARARARESIHERMVSEFLLGRRAAPHPYFFLASHDRHPGVSVVDLDRDGFDDVYVMARWGRNQLFRNRGDGSFEEIAAELGLDLEAHSSSAIFADFDNDGDADLFLGRTLRRSAYLENRDGHFVDRSTESVDEPLPYLASSISAVDYDQDGLLDVYISTYAANMLNDVVSRLNRAVRLGRYREEHPAPWFEYLPDEKLKQLLELQSTPGVHPWLNAAGPPNVLLHNVGAGRFEGVGKGIYRNTYQATWADFDGDGDPDVYLANDFAPDDLLRNDGDGRFSDQPGLLPDAQLGFGMGATWGDYDRDGRQDLYVTNMYSKAGRRITGQLGSLDPRFAQAAAGNFLYRNRADGLRRASGEGPDDLHVEHAGWGWGSLFADVDNDGFLDLFALSGYYTAPPSARGDVDT
jgi:hypothetical protein